MKTPKSPRDSAARRSDRAAREPAPELDLESATSEGRRGRQAGPGEREGARRSRPDRGRGVGTAGRVSAGDAGHVLNDRKLCSEALPEVKKKPLVEPDMKSSGSEDCPLTIP